MQGWKKYLILSFLIMIPMSKALAVNHDWLKQALQLQREIDLNTPIVKATFLGTHNSYNAKSYEIPLIRNIDPNQILSLYDQLEAGVRSLELDPHWTVGMHFKKEILLCHGRDNHLGCIPLDRTLEEGLIEIRNWLVNHPREVVLLYIDRALDNHEPRFTAILEKYLGTFIFKPSFLRDAHDTTHTCLAIPSTMTKRKVLSEGKQLLVIAGACDDPKKQYAETEQFPFFWNDDVFAGVGEIPGLPLTYIEENVNEFGSECGKEIFQIDSHHNTLWRIYEDRTRLTKIIHPKRRLEISEMKELIRCGVNWIAMDMLENNDRRLEAAIWSWAPLYPQTLGQCAYVEARSGIKNTHCDDKLQGFVCRNEKTDALTVVEEKGEWQLGEALCQQKLGVLWHFSLPQNGYEMDQLSTQSTISNLKNIWLNYAVNEHGKWQPYADIPITLQNAKCNGASLSCLS